MKILNELSIKDLKLNRKRSIVIIIGIILSTALICGVAGLITSFQKTFIETAKNSQGNYHAIFFNVPKDELKYIEENRGVEDYYLSEELGYSYLPDVKASNTLDEGEKPYVNVISMNEKFLDNMAIKIQEGRLPENDSELVISTRINEKFKTNYKVGDTIILNVGELKENIGDIKKYNDTEIQEKMEQIAENEIVNTTSKTYKIVGIIERPTVAIEPYEANWFTVITKMQTIDKKANIAVLYTNPYDYIKNTESINKMEKVKNDKAEGVKFNGLNNSYRSYKYNININKELLAYEGASLDDETLKTVYGLGVFIMAIVLVSSVFVIRNGFAISITERLKQYGMLSSIGATKKQIKKSVYFEGFILGLIGIPLGILSGILAIYILVNVVNFILKDYVSNSTLLTYGISWMAVVVSIIVSIVTIWLSCKRSAKKASKITPIEAIRSSEDVKLKAKKIKCPKIITKIFKTGGEIAYKNLKRSKKKYRTTVISIIVSVVIFIAISSFIEYGFKMSSAYYTEKNYNYVVYTPLNFSNEDKEEVAKEQAKKLKILTDISKLPNAGETSINKTNVFEMNMDDKHKSELTEYGKNIKTRYANENGTDEVNIVALSKDAYERYLNKIGGNYETYKDGAILIDNNINLDDKGKRIQGSMYNWKKGDSVVGKIDDKEYNIKIMARTEERPNGVENLYNTNAYFIVSEEFMEKVGYDSASLYAQSNDADQLDKEVEQYKKDNNINESELNAFNMEKSVRAENAVVLVISIFLYGFIGVITLIGITNIFNTITTNMNLRKKEFAMLKSIGMTKKEFNRMIRLESIFYGIKSLVIGIPIGVVLSYGIYNVFKNNMDMVYVLPIKAILISVVFVGIVIGIIMKYSMNKINKQNIIETIRNDNI